MANDPLTAAKREKARRLAGQMGPRPRPEAEGPTLREQLRAMGTGALQGFTLGWGDEIAGALWSAVDPDLTREQATGRVRRAVSDIEQTAPGAAFIGSMAGAAPAGGLAIGRLGNIATGGQRAVGTLAGGTLFGAASGAGEAPTMGDIPQYAGTGAAIGAGAGVAAPAAVGIARSLGRGVTGMGRAATPGGMERQFSQQEIARMIDESGYSMPELRERFEAFGPGTNLADILGDTGAEGLRFAAQTAPARPLVKRTLRERQLGERGIVTDEARRALGVADDVAQTERQMRSSRARTARRLYDEAYAQPVEMTEELQGLLNRPDVRSALARARRAAANEGRPLAPDAVDFRTLDYIKRELDERMRRVGRALETGKGSKDYISAKNLRNEFRGYLKEINPSYSEALENYSGDSAMLASMDEGRRIFDPNLRPREVREMMADMTDAERASFRMGVIDALEARMGRIRENADAARDFVTDDLQEKMSIVSTSEEAAEEFAGRMRGVQQRRLTANIAEGGPGTSRGETVERMMGERLEQATRGLRGGPFNFALDVANNFFRRRTDVTPEMRERIARALLTDDPSQVMRTLRTVETGNLRGRQLDRWAQRTTRALMGAMANPSVVQQAIRGE